MKKGIIPIFIVAILIIGCAKETGAPVIEEPSGRLKGVSLSPRSSSAEDFTGFFEEAVQAGEMVMWAGDWMQLEKVAKVVTGLAPQYGYIPLIEATFHSDGKTIRPLNEENKKIYRDAAVAFAEKYEPAFLGLGIEVNNVYLKSPSDFEQFVPFYNQVYEAVKTVSPRTRVFTVFQLERMKGLTLWELEETQAHWELIDKFKSDLIAFTTYPGLYYRGPSDIPADHYTEIKSHTTKPIAFTEIGWHSEASPQGWESSEQEQAEFIETFFNLTSGMDVKIAIWSFLYDPETIEPFNSMGLRRDNGTARPAWDAWIEP